MRKFAPALGLSALLLAGAFASAPVLAAESPVADPPKDYELIERFDDFRKCVRFGEMGEEKDLWDDWACAQVPEDEEEAPPAEGEEAPAEEEPTGEGRFGLYVKYEGWNEFGA